MATDAEMDVILRLIADTRGADQARASIRGVGQEAEGARRNLGNFSGIFDETNLARGALALAGVGVGLSVLATVGRAAHDRLQELADVTLKFGAQMAAVQAVSGATAAQMAALSAAAQTVGRGFGVGAVEAASGIQTLVKAGLSVQDTLNGALQATITLSRAGGVDLASAAEIAATAINTFNLRAADMAHVADLVAGAANASAIDVGDFRLSLTQAGAVSRTVGVSLDDLTTTIAVLGQAGLKSSDAGTSFRQFLLNLQPTSQQAIAALRQLGIITADGGNKFFDATGKLKSMSEVAQVLQDGLRGLTQAQQTATLQIAFGTDAVRAASTIAREGAAGFRDMNAEMLKTSAADVAAKRLDSLAGDIEKLKTQSEQGSLALGNRLEPGLRLVLKAASDLETVLGNIANNLLPKIANAPPTKIDRSGFLPGLLPGQEGPPGTAAATPTGEMIQKATAEATGQFARQFSPAIDEGMKRAQEEENRAGQQKQQNLNQQATLQNRLEALTRAQTVAGRNNLDLVIQESQARQQLIPVQERMVDVNARIADSQRQIEAISRQQAVAQRTNLDLVIQEATARLGLIPEQERLLGVNARIASTQRDIADAADQVALANERVAQVDDRIVAATDKRRASLLDEARLRAQIAATPAQDRLADLQTQQRELELEAQLRQPGARGALRGLIRSRAVPQAELAALEASRGITAAERAQRDAAAQQSLALSPLQRERDDAELAARALQRAQDQRTLAAQGIAAEQRAIQAVIDAHQIEIDQINLAKEADSARATIAVANLDKLKRPIEDQLAADQGIVAALQGEAAQWQTIIDRIGLAQQADTERSKVVLANIETEKRAMEDAIQVFSDALEGKTPNRGLTWGQAREQAFSLPGQPGGLVNTTAANTQSVAVSAPTTITVVQQPGQDAQQVAQIVSDHVTQTFARAAQAAADRIH